MSHTITLSSGRSFAATSGKSILDAAEESGIALPYSCRRGRCISCKCLVPEGTTAPIAPEEGLSDSDRAEGYVLSCVRTATSDISVEIEDLTGIEIPSATSLPARINSIDYLTQEIIRLVLRIPPKSTFNFLPGQYVDLIGPGTVRRSYSVAGADPEQKTIELHIKSVEGGAMSGHLFGEAKPNDLMRFTGPHGTFFLRDVAGKSLIFLATGTGIAPVLAMLSSLPEGDKAPSEVRVYWGGRHAADLYSDITSKVPNVIYTQVTSREAPPAGGFQGYVQDAVLADVGDLSDARVYACGSDEMIRSAARALTQAGLPARHFHSDAFVSSADPTR